MVHFLLLHSIPVCAYVYISITICFIHGYLHGFQSGTFPKSTAVNILLLVSGLYICALLFGHRGCISSAFVDTANSFPKQVYRCAVPCLLTFGVFCLSDSSHSSGCTCFSFAICIVVLICIFTLSNEVETVFRMCIGHLDILFCGHLFKYSAYFLFGLLSVFHWLVGSSIPFCCACFINGEIFKVLIFIFDIKSFKYLPILMLFH